MQTKKSRESLFQLRVWEAFRRNMKHLSWVLGRILFLFLWLHWVFVAACGLSLVAESRGYSLLRWLLLLWSTCLRAGGLQ